MTDCAYLPMAFLDAALKLLKNANYLLGHSTLMANDDLRSVRDKLKGAQKELQKVIHGVVYGETNSSSQSEMKVVIDEFVPKRPEEIDSSTPHCDDDEWSAIARCCIVSLYSKSDQVVIEVFLDGNLFEIRMGQKIPGTNWKAVRADAEYVHFQNDNIKARYHKLRGNRHE